MLHQPLDDAVQEWVNEFGPAAEATNHGRVFFLLIIAIYVHDIIAEASGGGHHQWVDEFAQQHEKHLHDQWY